MFNLYDNIMILYCNEILIKILLKLKSLVQLIFILTNNNDRCVYYFKFYIQITFNTGS